MRVKRMSLVLVVRLDGGGSRPAARQALAQDTKADPGLSDVLTDLLRGAEGEPADRRSATAACRSAARRCSCPSRRWSRRRRRPWSTSMPRKQAARTRSPFEGDPFFEQFFGRQMPPRAQNSLGSGVLVDPSGIVVTNFHVIRDADEVKVATVRRPRIRQQGAAEGRVARPRRAQDRFAASRFRSSPIGDSDALEVGDLVLAIGNPFGVGQTTTSGIVSALARSHIGVSDFGFFIQTDAAINPGNSGGALINMAGQLVGINTAIFSRSGGSIGIGFAIPSNMVRAVVDAAKAGSDFFERPYIGATSSAVTAQIAESLGMERPTGALVSAVDRRTGRRPRRG